jgi:hypothetical protein
MQLLKNHAYIYGFEDYGIVNVYSNIFKQSWDFIVPNYCLKDGGNYIITKDLPVKVSITSNSYWGEIVFEPSICKNHPKLLNTATKVYTHPSCKLSRTMMAEKYKKSLNPYLSDAVVVPKPDYFNLRLKTCVVFINEKSKILVKIALDGDADEDKDTINKLEGVQEGELLRNLMSCGVRTTYGGYNQFTIDDVLDAEFMYCGDILYVPNTYSYIMDILTNSIPADKIVFEESVQESLGTANNQLDFNSLTSIKDMLESSDSNTVAAGLKSLSMMDWMHYSNSVKYILSSVGNSCWRYNNAVNSTSVKYMLNTLFGSSNRRRWFGSFSNSIYNEDYELFKTLKMHYDKYSPDTIMDGMKFLDFMAVDPSGVIVPVLKGRSL